MVIAQVKKTVGEQFSQDFPESELAKSLQDDEVDEEEYLQFPPAFCIPGWATTDPTIEALIDASSSSGNGGGKMMEMILLQQSTYSAGLEGCMVCSK